MPDSTIIVSDSLIRLALKRGLVGMGILNEKLASRSTFHLYRQQDKKTKRETIGARITIKSK